MQTRLVAAIFVAALVLPSAWAADAGPEVQTLVKQLKDKDELVRLKAAKSLGKLGAAAKDAIPALTDALKDPDEDVRSVAKQALAKIKDAVAAADKGESLKLLARHLADAKSPDAGTRAAAVKGLADLLSNDEEIVRFKAAQGLGDAGAAAKEFVKQLGAAAKDPDELVRLAARKALAKIEAGVASEQRDLARAKLAPW